MLIVDHTELSRGHPVYPFLGMHDIAASARLLQCRRQIARRMPDLERDRRPRRLRTEHLVQRSCQCMEVMDGEVLLGS